MSLDFGSPTEFLNDSSEDIAASVEIPSDAEEYSFDSSMDVTASIEVTSDVEGLENQLEVGMDYGNLMTSDNNNTLLLPPDYSILITLLNQSKLLNYYEAFMGE
jgi:hypothetical protein